MKGLFVDTAGWMACADGSDPAHQAACESRDTTLEQGNLLVTTDYVMDQTLTLIRMRLGLRAAKAWWEQVEGSSRLRWEWIGMERAEKAQKAFFRYRDKNYSFTDCTSLVVMQELRLRQALTTDRHFRQMGFRSCHARPGKNVAWMDCNEIRDATLHHRFASSGLRLAVLPGRKHTKKSMLRC